MQEAIITAFGLAILSPLIHRVSPRFSGWLLGILIACLSAFLFRFLAPVASGESIRSSASWIAGLGVTWSFRLDGLSLTFGLLITGIGALVVIYAGAYWAGHAHLGRLYILLTAFMGSMLGVVFADNVLTLFVFWELTSLTSFFLIGINHDQPKARSAALQALLVTGAGGLALLAGLILLGQMGGSYELSSLIEQRTQIISHAYYLPMLLLILAGAFTKSAQAPFHFWLPNAMEAPTPVSTYLHSATMVKAGVYLLARLGPTIGDTPEFRYGVTGVGAITFALGAALALGQTDLKRILAYSTVSILGALTMLIGMGTREAASAMIVLLVAHALYKAALFLVAGAVDHETGTRDIRSLGGLGRFMPVTAAAALIAAASNAGLPPLFGWLAKEGMYEAIGFGGWGAAALILAGVVANALLVAVAFLVGWKPFFSATLQTPRQPHEAPLGMWIGPVVLAMGGAALGVWPAWIQPLAAAGASAVHGQPVALKLALWHGFNLVLVASAVTLAGGVVSYLKRERLLAGFDQLRGLARWGPDRAYAAGLEGMYRVARWQTRCLQSGYLRFYLLTVIMTVVGLAGYALLRGAESLGYVNWTTIALYEWAPLTLIILGMAMAVTVGSRLAAVAALGVVGYNVALIFVLFSAPDLAMTQFAVETLTVILFVLVLYRLPRFTRFTGAAIRARDVVAATAFGVLITIILLTVTAQPLQSRLSGFFASESLPQGKGRNIVNVILVDFRALDTLGEITVLAIAAFGIRALMKLVSQPGESK